MGELFGLPAEVVALLIAVWVVPVIAYVLHRIDERREGGYVSVLGVR